MGAGVLLGNQRGTLKEEFPGAVHESPGGPNDERAEQELKITFSHRARRDHRVKTPINTILKIALSSSAASRSGREKNLCFLQPQQGAPPIMATSQEVAKRDFL